MPPGLGLQFPRGQGIMALGDQPVMLGRHNLPMDLPESMFVSKKHCRVELVARGQHAAVRAPMCAYVHAAVA